jgi:hypothetical protein
MLAEPFALEGRTRALAIDRHTLAGDYGTVILSSGDPGEDPGWLDA